MSRKSFIESQGATCLNWTWSWSFINHEQRVVIFGAWDNNKRESNSHLILRDGWNISRKGNKQPGYSQAKKHIEHIQKLGYALMTFTMYSTDGSNGEDTLEPPKIKRFEKQLTLKALKEVDGDYFAVDLSDMAESQWNDTMDDLPGVDQIQIGSDNPKRFQTIKSNVQRDSRVRKEVIERAHNACELCKCERNFIGFLDVHHILGVEASDRVWTCVALCPNCHREAHYSPARKDINSRLSVYASQFNKTRRKR